MSVFQSRLKKGEPSAPPQAEGSLTPPQVPAQIGTRARQEIGCPGRQYDSLRQATFQAGLGQFNRAKRLILFPSMQKLARHPPKYTNLVRAMRIGECAVPLLFVAPYLPSACHF